MDIVCVSKFIYMIGLLEKASNEIYLNINHCDKRERNASNTNGDVNRTLSKLDLRLHSGSEGSFSNDTNMREF